MKYFAVLFIFFLNICAFGQEGVYFSNLKWILGEEEAHEAHVEDKIKIMFETEFIPDNEIIDIEIWYKTNNILSDLICSFPARVYNGIVEVDWIIELDLEDQTKYYYWEINEKRSIFMDYVFVVRYNNISATSKLLSIMTWIHHQVIDAYTKEPVRNTSYYILSPDSEMIKGETDDDGYIKLRNLKLIGKYRLII